MSMHKYKLSLAIAIFGNIKSVKIAPEQELARRGVAAVLSLVNLVPFVLLHTRKLMIECMLINFMLGLSREEMLARLSFSPEDFISRHQEVLDEYKKKAEKDLSETVMEIFPDGLKGVKDVHCIMDTIAEAIRKRDYPSMGIMPDLDAAYKRFDTEELTPEQIEQIKQSNRSTGCGVWMQVKLRIAQAAQQKALDNINQIEKKLIEKLQPKEKGTKEKEILNKISAIANQFVGFNKADSPVPLALPDQSEQRQSLLNIRVFEYISTLVKTIPISCSFIKCWK